MRKKNNTLAVAQRWRGAFWLALLSIAWLQVSFAAHQFDHSADVVFEDTCHACSHLDRLNDALPTASAPPVLPRSADIAPCRVQILAVELLFAGVFDARAPPQF